MDVSLVTLATVPAILALVNLAKGLGLAGKWSALVALLLGVVFSFSDYFFTTTDHTQAGFYAAVVGGAVLGLSASGLYDVAGKFGETSEIVVPDGSEEDPLADDEDEEVIDEDVSEDAVDEFPETQ